MTNAEFTVASATPCRRRNPSTLPTVGSVYDAFNLGHGYENIYIATPGADGTVTDTLVTPTGNVRPELAVHLRRRRPLNPGDAFTGLDVSGISGAPDAFSIGGFTLDPTAQPEARASTGSPRLRLLAPLLEIGGSSLGDPANSGDDLATQSFDVYSGSGSSATEIGTITTGDDVTNLLGLTNTQLIVTAVTPRRRWTPRTCRRWDRYTTRSTSATGTKTSTPRIPDVTDGVTTPGTVTDTLVTPYGNINLDSTVRQHQRRQPA